MGVFGGFLEILSYFTICKFRMVVLTELNIINKKKLDLRPYLWPLFGGVCKILPVAFVRWCVYVVVVVMCLA